MARESSCSTNKEFERHKRFVVLSYRLRCQAVKALKREKWRLEVWYAYYSFAPEAIRLMERADELVTLLGDVPEKVPDQARARYRRAINSLAETPLSDAELKQHLSTAQEAKGVYRRALSIPASIRDPLMTIAAIQKMATLNVQELYGAMPEIEANAKRARHELYKGRDTANQNAAEKANHRRQYYKELAEFHYWQQNPRLSCSEVARRLLRDQGEQIRKHLKLKPSEPLPAYHTVRKALRKRST